MNEAPLSPTPTGAPDFVPCFVCHERPVRHQTWCRPPNGSPYPPWASPFDILVMTAWCCRCYVQAGNPPSDGHPDCMATWEALAADRVSISGSAYWHCTRFIRLKTLKRYTVTNGRPGTVFRVRDEETKEVLHAIVLSSERFDVVFPEALRSRTEGKLVWDYAFPMEWHAQSPRRIVTIRGYDDQGKEFVTGFGVGASTRCGRQPVQPGRLD